MAEGPVPPDENDRLRELHKLEALDAPLDRDFQNVAELAASICRTPVALVNLVGGELQHLRGRVGVAGDVVVGRRTGLCPHVVSGRELLEVRDALADPRFRDDPLVAGEPYLRFYAGAPVIGGHGHVLGTVCVMDHRPRLLAEEQKRALRLLACHAAAMLELRHHARQGEKVARHLEEVADLKHQFLRNINHELRTPLTSIRSYLQLLQDGGLEEDTERDFLQVIERNSDRLLERLDELLLMASLSAHTAAFSPQRVDLAGLTRRAVEEAVAKSAGRDHDMRLRIATEAPVWADPDRLRYALVHLLDNAIKFTPAAGVINVTVTAVPPAVEIHDAGIGIGEEDVEHVFEDFYRSREAEEQAIGGTGVGLSIVSRIVELHGGSVELRSTLHEGTCVRVTLPEAPAAGPPEDHRDPQDRDGPR
ncbi:GAF domain-containing sensor histidine kinase [Planobispora takensis]|uniref:histidine kinase n=1 Tax=Planobispora takensis TaxID=1367882 RepID=A0A8J3SZQ4_9ACTN|nr:GAF domain-containing sensor histidine kinase [Planobispora takensis]GII03644.1 sensor histidine kinase [Planobispora takensis]